MDRPAQSDPAQVLIQRIEDETQKELEKILSAATDEAAAKVKAAHRKALRRIQFEIEVLRRSREDALRHEEARLDTLRRQLRQREAGTVIETGLPILRRVLVELWAEQEARTRWVGHAIAAAAERLRGGTWTVEHPQGWSEHERATVAKRIKEASGHEPEIRSRADLEAGLIVQCDNARLDASLSALIRHPEAIGAELLAVLLENAGEPQ